MNIVILTMVAYLFGAVPFGLLVAKSRGVDIREKGSGNIGATNVFRVVGKGWGVFTFTLDALKGFVAAGWPMLWLCALTDVLAISAGSTSCVWGRFSRSPSGTQP